MDKDTSPAHLQPLYRTAVPLTRRDYCCSACFGHLVVYDCPDKPGWFWLVCANCQEDTRGYVRKTWAEHRQAMSQEDYLEARDNYPGLAPRPHKGKTAEQLLKELGF